MRNGIKMKLSKLFEELNVDLKDLELEVEGICSHSKEVQKGDLFVAKSGRVFKGSEFLKEAIDRGAVAIVTDQEVNDKAVPVIYIKDTKQAESKLASKFYHNPSKKLKMVGLTGTNGKTTTSYLIRQLVGEENCGLIGTIEYLLGNEKIEASLTTPDVTSNHKMLAKMVENGLQYAVMEATSIALTQNRLDYIDFDVALFTNFSQDHLDYHHTMENYLNAKITLFENLSPDKTAVLNSDMKEVDQVLKKCRSKIITYGVNNKADIKAQNIVFEPNKTSFELIVFGDKYPVVSPLLGLYNVYNVLAALAVGYSSGINILDLIDKVRNLKPPPGRLEKVPNRIGAEIFIDFAHTEDALKNALQTLGKIKKGRLVSVFGCGGDRDPKKRPSMGKTVSDLSDITIITSDNPRGEDPAKICDEVLKGCASTKQVLVEVDRKTAIRKAIELLKPNDVLLIAGRGHERYQKIRGKEIPFEDYKVTLKLLHNQSL